MENALREKAELEAQVKYLQSQLGQFLEKKRRSLRNSRSLTKQGPPFELEGDESHPNGSFSDESEERRPFRPRGRGNLDAYLFLDWLRTVDRAFDYKDILDEKKVKLVALKLHKYALILWANAVVKRAIKGKGKIHTRNQMRHKLKAKFLPTHYL